MGWLFYAKTRSTLIADLVEHNPRIKRHCLRGNVLWAVVQEGDGRKWIACTLLSNGGRSGWGYKELDESCHPFYYSCPMSYLTMVPVACQEWRDAVIAYHNKQVIAA